MGRILEAGSQRLALLKGRPPMRSSALTSFADCMSGNLGIRFPASTGRFRGYPMLSRKIASKKT